MRKCLIPVVILSAFSFPSLAADYSIKGMEIGASVEAFKDSFDCSSGPEGRLSCYQNPATFTVGGEKLKSVLIKFGADEKVEAIVFGFDPDSFLGIRDAVTQKYPKIKCRKVAVTTLMGVTLPGESCIGSTANESIELSKYGRSIDSGSVVIIKNDMIDQSKKTRKEKRSDI